METYLILKPLSWPLQSGFDVIRKFDKSEFC
jgi:hypothetical protein